MTKDKQIIEKHEILLSYLIREYGDRFKDDIQFKKLSNELSSLETKPKRKSRYIPRVKICAGCGSIAHGNPGHDIII